MYRHLQLNGLDFPELFTVDGLTKLDTLFVEYLKTQDAHLASLLTAYRAGELLFPISEWIIATAPILEDFIAELFQIESEVKALKSETRSHDPIFIFKDYYLQKAKRLQKTADLSEFPALTTWLESTLSESHFKLEDKELAIAKLGQYFLQNEDQFKSDIERLIRWTVLVQQHPDGQCMIKNWRTFHLPQKKHFENLVPMVPVENDPYSRFEGPRETQRERDGFQLTDPRMSLRSVLDEVHYCVYCHKNDGDFCSKGFPVKKNNPELGFKINPANDLLTGCPLEEKISEMNVVKKEGFGIAALAIVTIDNPMCAVTGHRICNDCMKSCIYQKQDPVNIPEIETRVLTDVLDLPWGVEIYDLLIRWNPLRETQFLPLEYTHKKILIMGMGPAGFTLAHHLLMEGCAVVGFDGLKIEPLPKHLLTNPIYDFNSLKESLDDRIMTGFGGVAEYGITVRWDKNFLKLIYLSLSRRPLFQVFGGVRFGGTITVEKAWELGFDHLSIAVGAGLSRELSIPNSLAKGMRPANDFLMALQLTGAIKKSSLANLQVRLPAVVIGGGLTGVDTATEVQAYYIVQIEKIHQRYHILKSHLREDRLRQYFDAESLEILDEFLSHAEKIIIERELAKKEKRLPKLNDLIRSFGGVTIAYRKSIQESPAYQRNHEEVIKALEEGIYYAEGLEPVSVLLDKYGSCDALICRTRVQDETGQWMLSSEEQTLPAKSIFVATGAKPNIAYEFEHRGTFVRAGDVYRSENGSGSNVKSPYISIFTSYEKDHHRVSFIGDTHPVFHGSVVKAIASAKRGYPKIMQSIRNACGSVRENSVAGSNSDYPQFRQKIAYLFDTKIISIIRHTEKVVETTVQAPMAAEQFQPGQFYRIQNYETYAETIDNTKLQTESIAALGIYDPNTPRQLSFFIIENGASTKLISTLKNNEPISIMGPTGAKLKIADMPQNYLIVGDAMSIPYLLSVAPTLKKHGHHIYFIAAISKENQYAIDRIEALTDNVIFCSHENIISEMEKINLSIMQNIIVIGQFSLIKMVQNARQCTLKNKCHPEVKFNASVYGPMQCMLKGVCAQCLQWQIDPMTGKRTKAVYACSWQHQPMEMIDIDHLGDRLGQNRAQEILTNLWVDYICGLDKNPHKNKH